MDNLTRHLFVGLDFARYLALERVENRGIRPISGSKVDAHDC